MVSLLSLRRARGFTLPELMLVVAIVGILASVAAPSFSSMIASARSRSVSSELYAALSRARSEAIKRNAEVALVPATDSDWHSGWSIETVETPTRTLDSHPLVKGATMTGPESVVYLPNGRTRGSTLPAIDIAVSGGGGHRCVRVDLSGRPNETKTTC